MPTPDITGNSMYVNPEAERYIEGIRATKNKMKAEFEEFNSIMNTLASGNSFVGAAGTAYFAKYNSLKQEYTYFEQLFESFASDFQRSVEGTEQTNRALEQAVADISNVEP